jgi:phage terminase large subunit-like protein
MATMALTEAEEIELLQLLEAEDAYQQHRLFYRLFPAGEGPTALRHYPKQAEFFAASATHREIFLCAGNRTGKTMAGLYALTCHLTGLYPAWWEGKRFARPIQAVVAGDSSKTVREIVQAKLLGPYGRPGTGILPGATLRRVVPKPGVPEAVELARTTHVSGGESVVRFQSYDQGRDAFQGVELDVVLLDEEPPLAIYTEALVRTMTTDGLVMLTFTPLLGLSDTVLQFLPDGQFPDTPSQGSKYLLKMTWDDVPHLAPAVKAELLAAIPAYQREARSRGIPVLGSGVVYPVSEDTYLVDPFELPKHWKRCYGLDVGWNRTAGIWGAYNPETAGWTLYHEYYGSHDEPSVHASAIKAPGSWVPGVIDPAARGRSQADGRSLLATYTDLGLQLSVAQNAVEAGIYQVWERLSQGRLQVFRTLPHWRKEARLYRRDERGHVVKTDDHLMDATRYLVLSGLEVARAHPVPGRGAGERGLPSGVGWTG